MTSTQALSVRVGGGITCRQAKIRCSILLESNIINDLCKVKQYFYYNKLTE